jgi:hypothetical protein
MPKKKKENEIKPDEQWERFKEAAADAQVDTNRATQVFKEMTGRERSGCRSRPRQSDRQEPAEDK